MAITRSASAPAAVTEAIRDVDADLKRVLDTMARLRSLAHPEQQTRTPTDLNQVLADARKIACENHMFPPARIACGFHPDLPAVSADPLQLTQVFVNLLENAIDAVSSCPPEDPAIRVTSRAREDGFIEASIHDTGPGIPPDDLRRIFTPFFTTKPAGSGIGLSLCHTIIAAHGGRIEAENHPRRSGATFRVVLPVDNTPT